METPDLWRHLPCPACRGEGGHTYRRPMGGQERIIPCEVCKSVGRISLEAFQQYTWQLVTQATEMLALEHKVREQISAGYVCPYCRRGYLRPHDRFIGTTFCETVFICRPSCGHFTYAKVAELVGQGIVYPLLQPDPNDDDD